MNATDDVRHTGRVAEHTLILLRHAKSDWSGHEDDHDRPLANRGRRQAPEDRTVAGCQRRLDRPGGRLHC